MTRKHFEALAEGLKFAHPGLTDHDTPEVWVAWRDSVLAVARTCATFNPHFQTDRFTQACTPAGRTF